MDGAIYDTILKYCQPFELALNPLLKGPVPDFYTCPQDPSALRNDLRSNFTIDQLTAAGVIRRGADSRSPNLSWTAPLSSVSTNPCMPSFDELFSGDSDALLFSVRRAQAEPPLELITNDGCLSRRQLPIMAIGQHHALQIEGDQRFLFVTDSLADAAYFWRLGLAATTATGLETLGQPILNQFCQRFGIRRCDGIDSLDSAPASSAPKLILVLWSPSRMDFKIPPRVYEAACHFEDLSEQLAVDLNSIVLWQPANTERAKFLICTKYGDGDDVVQAMTHSVEQCPQHTGDRYRQRQRQPENAAEADVASVDGTVQPTG